jgi:hypothetical protein
VPMRVSLALRCAGLLVLASSSAHARPQELTAKLAQLAGAGAIDCNDVGDPTSVQAAFACATKSVALSKSFIVSLEFPCPDCKWWLAAAGSASGMLWEVVYDTNRNGASTNTPELKTRQCSSLAFNSATVIPPILCVPANGH